jgi:hypothetical protein
MSTVFQELDSDALAGILAGSRQRGEYDRQIGKFVESGLQAAEVNLTDGPFAGKKPNSVKTGLEGAIKREGAPEEAKNLRVIVQQDKVYLVVQA